MNGMNMTAVRPENRQSINPAPIVFQVGKERLKLNLVVKDVALRMFFCLQTTRDVHECPMDNEGRERRWFPWWVFKSFSLVTWYCKMIPIDDCANTCQYRIYNITYASLFPWRSSHEGPLMWNPGSEGTTLLLIPSRFELRFHDIVHFPRCWTSIDQGAQGLDVFLRIPPSSPFIGVGNST